MMFRILVLFLGSVPLFACQTTPAEPKFDATQVRADTFQTFCRGVTVSEAEAYFSEPLRNKGYLNTGNWFAAGKASEVTVLDDRIVHIAPRITVVYCIEQAQHDGDEGVKISSNGFFDEYKNGDWQPMIAALPRRIEGSDCFNL